jgi:methylglutaconyl-CoA hydratase
MDAAVSELAAKLAASNPEAMAEIKKTFWADCAHWGDLLAERAAVSGRLVLSDFTRDSIARFKSK